MFTIFLFTELEPQQSNAQRVADHQVPQWPLKVEASIQSATGAKTDLTYQPVADAQASVDTYNLEVAVFKKLKLRAPYRPQSLNNHCYVPFYKGQRVIISLDFQSAEIIQVLDWRQGAKQPTDSQSNHLLLGKPAKGHTSMLYKHVNNKAEFSITRDDEGDKQVLELKDGVIVLKRLKCNAL